MPPNSSEPNPEPTEQKPKKTYGTHATMPVLQADKYAEIELPELPEWDPMAEEGGLKLDATIVACGKRRTGKSWAFRNLMYLLKDKIPAGIVISQTDELNKYWRDYYERLANSAPTLKPAPT